MKKVIINEAIDRLKQGKVGIIPTDTVYGLVALASDEQAVNKMYNLKNREVKPGTIIAENIDQLVELGIKRRYLKPVEHYWPYAISIVIPTGFALDYLHLGKQSLAVRVTDNEELRNLLRNSGALVTTSANQPGKPPAETIEKAQEYFGDNVDFYVDGGKRSSQPSTIIRIVDDAVELLREGTVKIDEETGRIIE